MEIENIELAKVLLDRIKRLETFKTNRDEPIKLIRAKDDVLQISGQLRQHSRNASSLSEAVMEQIELANATIYGAVNIAIDEAIKILKARAELLGAKFPKETL